MGVDVVVDGLRQTDDGERVAVIGKVGGEICGGRVRVVPADGVQDRDAVAGELLCCALQRVLSVAHEAAPHAVGDVRELDAAVSEGAAAMLVQQVGLRPGVGPENEVLALQEAGVAVPVADDVRVGNLLGVALDEAADG